MSVVDKPITWRTIFRAGFVWGAEYALLGLIEDSSTALKVATIVCALAALAALEADQWLNRYWKYLALTIIALVGAVYISVIGYAVENARHNAEIVAHLSNLYDQSIFVMSEGTPLVSRPAPPTKTELGHFVANINKWRDETEKYLSDNLGPTYAYRFGNTLGRSPYLIGLHQDLSMQMNYLVDLQHNLLAIHDALRLKQ